MVIGRARIIVILICLLCLGGIFIILGVGASNEDAANQKTKIALINACNKLPVSQKAACLEPKPKVIVKKVVSKRIVIHEPAVGTEQADLALCKKYADDEDSYVNGNDGGSSAVSPAGDFGSCVHNIVISSNDNDTPGIASPNMLYGHG